VTLTLILDRIILHMFVHHSSTSTYLLNFIKIEETCCGRTHGRTFETCFIRSTLSKSRPNNNNCLCSEADYAFNRQKPTLALQLEAGYKPDGWLGPLCLNNILCDFSDPQKFDEEWCKLRDKLTEMKLGANEPEQNEGSSPQPLVERYVLFIR